MRNTYFTSYFPLISIILFSTSFALYAENQILIIFKQIGLYVGLQEFFSVAEIKMTLLFIILILFFMIFAAMKLLSDTILQLALLLFSKEMNGESLKSARMTSIIFCGGGAISVFCSFSVYAVILVFFITTMVAFTYLVYKASFYLSTGGLIGFVFFQVVSWGVLLSAVGYTVLKFYNGLLESLPI